MKKIISIILSLLSLTLLLSGCGSQKADPSQEAEVRAFLVEQLEVFKDASRDSTSSAVKSDENEELFYDNTDLSLYYKYFDYSIGDISRDGDSATAVLTLKNIDFGSVYIDYFQKLSEFSESISDLSDDEYNTRFMEEAGKIFSDLMENGDYELLENTVTVKLTKNDGVWSVDNTDEFTAALLVGMSDAFVSDTY